MLNSFEFNGTEIRDFESDAVRIIVRKSPNMSRPARKYDRYSVRGRNGDIYVPQDAFDNYVQSYEIFLYTYEKGFELNEFAGKIADWLYGARGYEKLIDDHELDYFRLAFFTGPFGVENLLTEFGKATVEFSCRPERFLEIGDEDIAATSLTNGWLTLQNPTSYISKPLIETELKQPNSSTLYDKVKIQVQHNGTTKDWMYERQTLANTTLVCDSDSMTWSTAADYAGKNVSGPQEMPALGPGENKVRIVGCNSNGTELSSNQYPVWTIRPRWWTL